MSQLDREKAKVTPDRRGSNSLLRPLVLRLQWLIWLFARHWLVAANLLSGLILLLGFLAPALMAEGLTAEGEGVYRFLAPHNHQLPQRSYFLFGEKGGVHTYSQEQILAQGADPHSLQTFTGNPDIGFKTALNHRMIAIFVALFLGGVGWGLAGGRPRFDLVLFTLLTMPILLDGFSHMISERTGLGFRETNGWAMTLTGGMLPLGFYQGTTIGTLNWWLRTLTGLLFGLGLAGYLYTYLARRFAAARSQLEPKLRRAGLI